MTVLGCSHIVTEVEDFNESIIYYEQLGYTVEYDLFQIVPDQKKTILLKEPTEVHIYYLRDFTRSRIGIELIKHNKSVECKRIKNIAYGWSRQESKTILAKDPDENHLIQLSYSGNSPNQHIFIPTGKFLETVQFYSNTFSLTPQKESGEFSNIYQKLYGEHSQSVVLVLASCLSPNWEIALHIVETKKYEEEIFLNETGFSCFCFLINQAEYSRLQTLGLEIVGPLEGEKKINNRVTQFLFGFIRDPNGYLVEYYIP